MRFSLAEDWEEVFKLELPFVAEDGGDVGILDFFPVVADGKREEFVLEGEWRRAVRRGDEEGDFSTTGVEKEVETETVVELEVCETLAGSSSVCSGSMFSVTRGESSDSDWSDW